MLDNPAIDRPSAGTIAPFAPVKFSMTWTFFNGHWHEGNAPIMGARTHAAWLGSMVFDGARAFEGVTPDLDLHCARVNQSAEAFLLRPMVSTQEWIALAREGMRRFDRNAELYIRPMYWAETGGARRGTAGSGVDPLVPLHLRGADAEADGRRDHPVAVPAAHGGVRSARR
jgi:branched-subunit amino acid aminotransferase/4-amino-4-deoxychorismate lyase